MLLWTIVCLWSSFFIIYHILLILCNFLTYCFELVAYCKSAVSMTNSTFNPTCADDGSVNVHTYVSMCVTSFKLLYYIFLFGAECSLLLCIGAARGEHIYTSSTQHLSIDEWTWNMSGTIGCAKKLGQETLNKSIYQSICSKINGINKEFDLTDKR